LIIWNICFIAVFPFKSENIHNAIDGYKFLESYSSRADKKFSSHVGLYESPDGEKIIVKSLFYRFKNLKYQQTVMKYLHLNNWTRRFG